ncbi:MAG: YfhO family protein [Anaerolineae bacterium]|nr:YfhO family protein [Anaerolineae bacterium]
MKFFKGQQLFIGLIIFLPFVLFWRWGFTGEVLFWGTPLYQFWPWHQLVKTSVLTAEWPLWNPLLGNGTPLLANLQTAVFYPPNLLYLFLPVEHGLTLSVVLHLILAELLMYIYARYIDLSPFAATVSALTYMFSGYLIGRTQFVTMVNAIAWFPLLLLLGDRIATRRQHRDILWLGLVLAIQFLAGHAQLWFYGLWLSGAYIFFRSWQAAGQPNHTRLINPKQCWLAVGLAGLKFGLAVGLAMLLAAVQILPTAELTAQSARQSGAERLFALSYSFWPWRLITLLAPDFFGHPARGNYWGYANYWEDHAYIGVLPFLLALIAIWHYLKSGSNQRNLQSPAPDYAPPIFRQIVPFFALLIPISLILAMGWHTPVYLWVFNTIPGFDYFQAPARLLIWYTLAITILAGIGAQTFDLTTLSWRGWRRFLIAGVGITLAGLIGRFFLVGRSLTFLTATLTLGVLLTISIIILLNYPLQKSLSRVKETLWQVVVLIFVALDLLWFAFPLIPSLPTTIFNQPIIGANFLSAQAGQTRFFVDDQFAHAIKFNRYFRFDAFGPLRVDYWQGFKETLVPNVGIYANLPTANNDDPLTIGRWQQLSNLVKQSGPAQQARLLAMMNVGYFIGSSSQPTWPVSYDDGTIAIQRIPNVLPRAYFVAQAYPAPTTNDIVDRLTSPNFDPNREVIIMDTGNALNLKPKAHLLTDIWPVDVNEQGWQRVSLLVDAPTAGFVVLTDTFYPGWEATVDGQPTAIWPANLAFRAVAVAAGEHEIVFRYRPASFIAGLWLNGITLVIMSIIAAWPLVRHLNLRKSP